MSNSDARTVATDAGDTLGTLIDEHAHRDAIHLAVEPMQAGCTIWPGDRLEIRRNGKAYGVRDIGDDEEEKVPLGICDPFLKDPVKEGEWFWFILMPRTIRSLRHVWEHPAFPSVVPVAQTSEEADPEKVLKLRSLLGDPEATAELYIDDLAVSLDLSKEELMDHAKSYIEHGNYLTDGGKYEGMHIPEEFWDHYEELTKTKVSSRGSFLSCSC